MKRIIISLFIATLFIVLIYSIFINPNYFKIQNNTQNTYQDNCKKYKDQIQYSLMQYNISQEHEIKDSDNTGDNPSLGLYTNYKELKDIFYSPVTKSCLYVKSLKTLFKPVTNNEIINDEWLIAHDTYYLIDITSEEQLILKDEMPWAHKVWRGHSYYSELEIQSSIDYYKKY